MTQQIVRPTIPIDDLAFRELSRDYSFDSPNEVRNLLSASPRLAVTLRQLPEQVRRVFGRERPLHLRVSSDPETPSEKEFVVYIAVESETEDEWNEVEGRIRRLHSEWLMRLPREDTRLINLEVE